MPRHYESSAAVCPFYHGEETTDLFCDGFSPGMSINLSFTSENAAKKIKLRYCRSNWTQCPLAKMLTVNAQLQNRG